MVCPSQLTLKPSPPSPPHFAQYAIVWNIEYAYGPYLVMFFQYFVFWFYLVQALGLGCSLDNHNIGRNQQIDQL